MKGRHARVLAGAAAVARTRLGVIGAAGLGLGLAAALLGVAAMLPDRSGEAPKVAAVNVLTSRPAPTAPVRPARDGDQGALAFYQNHDPVRAEHVTEAIWTGPMLRVYTNLPAAEADSRTAIALCETAAAYVSGQGRIPVVFVHADRAAGYQVLANKLDERDDCRLDRVP